MKQNKKRILSILLAFVLVAMSFTGLETKAAENVSENTGEEVTVVTKDKLKAVIDEANKKKECYYTRESWQKFQDALKFAEGTYAYEKATQELVDEAVTWLESATYSLEELEQPGSEVDRRELWDLIDEAHEFRSNVRSSAFTKESWNYFEMCLENAEEVAYGWESTQADVDLAARYLACSIDTLKLVKDMSKAEVTLSTTKYTYDGKMKSPKIEIVDEWKLLEEGRDYKVTRPSGRTKIGRYTYKITYMGDYKGSSTASFTIGPKNTTEVRTSLYGHDDVKVSWNKVSGATGYKVYYRKSTSGNYTYLGRTTSNYYKKSGLTDGAKYYFKVTAYKTINGYRCENGGKTDSIYTLKKIATPEVEPIERKVRVRWENIPGESGYQISKSTSSTGTNIISNYKTTSGTTKTFTVATNVTYYYKVRAYKQVGTTKVYGPWSSVVKFKRKPGYYMGPPEVDRPSW